MQEQRRNKLNGLLVFFLIVLFLLPLISCRKTALYHDLAEGEANDILVLLSQNGIDAGKKQEIRQNQVYWTINVPSGDISKARNLLQQNNLPRKKAAGLEEVYKEKGLIPTPDEQKARFLLALKGEIINSLEKIPEIVDVDVVLNIPEKDEFAEEGAPPKRPSAAVIIKSRPPFEGTESPLSEAKIQKFVANSIENLDPRDVSVIISYSGASSSLSNAEGHEKFIPLGKVKDGVLQDAVDDGSPKEKVTMLGITLDAASKKRVKIYLVIFFGLLVLLSAGLVIMIIKTSKLKEQVAGGGGETPLIEGNVVGGPRQLEPPDGME